MKYKIKINMVLSVVMLKTPKGPTKRSWHRPTIQEMLDWEWKKEFDKKFMDVIEKAIDENRY